MPSSTLHRFRLFIAGATPNSAAALHNLNKICGEHLADAHEIEVVDVFLEPRRALVEGVFLTPTLVKLSPLPVQRFVGTLVQPADLLLAIGVETAPRES